MKLTKELERKLTHTMYDNVSITKKMNQMVSSLKKVENTINGWGNPGKKKG